MKISRSRTRGLREASVIVVQRKGIEPDLRLKIWCLFDLATHVLKPKKSDLSRSDTLLVGWCISMREQAGRIECC